MNSCAFPAYTFKAIMPCFVLLEIGPRIPCMAIRAIFPIQRNTGLPRFFFMDKPHSFSGLVGSALAKLRCPSFFYGFRKRFAHSVTTLINHVVKVLFLGSYKKMIRIATGRCIARVANVLSLWDVALVGFVHNPMWLFAHGFFVNGAKIYRSISFVVQGSRKNPTAGYGLLDFFHDSFLYCFHEKNLTTNGINVKGLPILHIRVLLC